MNRSPLDSAVLHLHPRDEVVVALRDLPTGSVVEDEPGGRRVVLLSDVAQGHKVAVAAVPAGAPVHKYGQTIGRARVAIAPGERVHTENLEVGVPTTVREIATRHTRLDPPAGPVPTFRGYRRANGAVGTRNYVGVITSVNCSATAAALIAEEFRGKALDEFDHVDGVVALTHQSGCGLVSTSEGAQTLLRTLQGYARHPNFGGLLVLGLGCEMVVVDSVVDEATMPTDTMVSTLTIQEAGGVRATVREGVQRIRQMLSVLNERRRQDVPASELVLGLNCGGSDGFSGISANPALGRASDRLVAWGATSILAETPEVFGAEHLLTARAVTTEVGQRLIDRIEWWQDYATRGGGSLDNNPSPGNKAGGLTTILEKSLGAVEKGGRADLTAVYQYAERVTERGLVFMDTPGYDPVSVTGIIAGGATVVCFTTGRGSVFGSKPTPTIKIATNTALYERMPDDMDLNAGLVVDGAASLDQVGDEIVDLILRVASGQRTASEELGIGQQEFVPWTFGTVT